MNLKYTLLLLCLPVGMQTFAQTHRNEFGFQSDNDSFLAQGSDRYYTNGLFVFFRRGLTVDDTTRLKNKVLGIEAGQKIFNPASGQTPDREMVDRPFAAYLYAGANLNFLYNNESNLKLGAQIGMVGPAALGRQAQEVIHNTFGFYELQGWEYQIRNNFQFNLQGEYNRLLGRAGKDADVSLNTYANLGTGFTGAGAGFLVRLGNFNQLFNSVSTQSTAIKQRGFEPLNKHEFFFYLRPTLRFVAYDATIEGSLFNNDNNGVEVRLTRKPIVFSQQFGITYGGERWIFDISAVFQTKDTKEMLKAHQWGSATILYRFN